MCSQAATESQGWKRVGVARLSQREASLHWGGHRGLQEGGAQLSCSGKMAGTPRSSGDRASHPPTGPAGSGPQPAPRATRGTEDKDSREQSPKQQGRWETRDRPHEAAPGRCCLAGRRHKALPSGRGSGTGGTPAPGFCILGCCRLSLCPFLRLFLELPQAPPASVLPEGLPATSDCPHAPLGSVCVVLCPPPRRPPPSVVSTPAHPATGTTAQVETHCPPLATALGCPPLTQAIRPGGRSAPSSPRPDGVWPQGGHSQVGSRGAPAPAQRVGSRRSVRHTTSEWAASTCCLPHLAGRLRPAPLS